MSLWDYQLKYNMLKVTVVLPTVECVAVSGPLAAADSAVPPSWHTGAESSWHVTQCMQAGRACLCMFVCGCVNKWVHVKDGVCVYACFSMCEYPWCIWMCACVSPSTVFIGLLRVHPASLACFWHLYNDWLHRLLFRPEPHSSSYFSLLSFTLLHPPVLLSFVWASQSWILVYFTTFHLSVIRMCASQEGINYNEIWLLVQRSLHGQCHIYFNLTISFLT